MMNKISTNTLILFIFTTNVLLLVFLGNKSPLLGLFSKLISIAGLLWLINFYYKTLKLNNGNKDDHLNQNLNRYIIKDNPNSQFSDMIDASFSLIKDITDDFEVGVYFFQPDSNLLELKSFTSEIFIDSISLDNGFIENLNVENPQKLIFQKDNKEHWQSLFRENSVRGSESAILQPLFMNEILAEKVKQSYSK